MTYHRIISKTITMTGVTSGAGTAKPFQNIYVHPFYSRGKEKFDDAKVVI